MASLRLDAEAALRTFSNACPRWSPDRRSLLFRSNRDGNWAAYVSSWRALDLPPDPVSPRDSAIVDATFSRDGGHVLLLDAVAGPRLQARLHVVSLDGHPVHSVELDPFHAGTFWMPRWVRSSVLLDTWHADTGEARLLAIEGAASRVAVRFDHRGRIADVDATGRKVLVVEQEDSGTSVLREIALDGSANTLVYGHNEAWGELTAAAYAPYADAVLVAVQDAGSISRLVRVSLPRAERRVALEATERPGRIDQVLVSAHGSALALALDVASHTEMLLLDAVTFRARGSFSLPLGVGRLGAFSVDGKVLTFSWETAESPGELFETTVQHVRVRRLRDEAHPSLAALEGVTAQEVPVELPTAGGDHAKLFRPRLASGAPPLPVVVRVSEPQEDTRVRWRPEMRHLVSQRVAVLEAPTGLRTLPGAPKRDQTSAWRIAGALGQWATQQPWAMSDAVTVALDGVDAQTLCPLGDLVPWRGIALTYGARIERRSGAPWGDRSAPPSLCGAPRRVAFWVYQGRCDERWPRTYTDAVVQRLRAEGCSVEYVVQDVCASGAEATAAEVDRLARFALFVDRLRPSSP
ncbi:MAG: hypothetical protein MUF54_23060 [Polyangiaceae bacterium]|jgi:hypothetical protein|nr:hypothetical protein [Polyangiaceae bacterium]